MDGQRADKPVLVGVERSGPSGAPAPGPVAPAAGSMGHAVLHHQPRFPVAIVRSDEQP